MFSRFYLKKWRYRCLSFLRHHVVVIVYINPFYQNKVQLLEIFCWTFSFYSLRILHAHMLYFVCVYNAMASLSKNWKHGDGKRTRRTKINCFAIFRLPSYCVEETIEFDVKALFVSRPVSRLVKPSDITKNFKKRPLVPWN